MLSVLLYMPLPLQQKQMIICGELFSMTVQLSVLLVKQSCMHIVAVWLQVMYYSANFQESSISVSTDSMEVVHMPVVDGEYLELLLFTYGPIKKPQ